MKILYGVVGEGMGHALRSRVVLDHLLAEGHEVEIVSSQRAVDYLQKHFPRVHRIHGLHIVTEENRVRRGKTVFSNVLKGTAALPGQIRSYFDLISSFRPEAVVTDFESWTYLYAKSHRLPVVSIDNQQLINRCKHPPDVLQGYRQDFELTRAFVKSKLPFCDHYLITTFFFPPVRKERTSLHPPILRPEILSAQPRRGEHLLVYQTAEGHHRLADVLQQAGMECRVYGMRRQITEEQVEGNLRYRPFDEARFIEDLATARAVVTGGGFTVMSEAVYLHKPVLSVPIVRQFEQILNARYLQHEGYGHHAQEIDPHTLQRFLDDVPRCEENLTRYHQDGNEDLFRALDGQLDRAAAGV
ncbi:MAG: MJ1255/VC2487 family glycosyltransferase [Myxococcota bacterium]